MRDHPKEIAGRLGFDLNLTFHRLLSGSGRPFKGPALMRPTAFFCCFLRSYGSHTTYSHKKALVQETFSIQGILLPVDLKLEAVGRLRHGRTSLGDAPAASDHYFARPLQWSQALPVTQKSLPFWGSLLEFLYINIVPEKGRSFRLQVAPQAYRQLPKPETLKPHTSRPSRAHEDCSLRERLDQESARTSIGSMFWASVYI